MSAEKKPKPFDAVMEAVDLYTTACGEAQWTNGYRTARGGYPDNMFDKELKQYARAEVLHKALKKALNRALKDARLSVRAAGGE